MSRKGLETAEQAKKKRILRKIAPSFRVYRQGVFLRNFRLTKQELTLGSQPSCDIVLEDREVSPQHCALKVKQGKGLFLAHLKGSIPTKINSVILSTEKKLAHGDQIELGPYTISVSLRVREQQTEEGGVARIELPKSLLKEQPAPAEKPVVRPTEQAPAAEATEIESLAEKTEFDAQPFAAEEKTIIDISQPLQKAPADDEELDQILAPLEEDESQAATAEAAPAAFAEEELAEELPELDAQPVTLDLSGLKPLEDSDAERLSDPPPPPPPAEEVPPVLPEDSVEVPAELEPLPDRQVTEAEPLPPKQKAAHDLLGVESEETIKREPPIVRPSVPERKPAEAEYTLRYLNTAHTGKEIKISGEELIVGRRKADITIPDSTVSKRHLLLEKIKGQGLRLRDLGSANGTYVNSERVSECFVKHGDRIELGRVALELAVLQPQPVEAPVPLEFEDTHMLGDDEQAEESLDAAEPQVRPQAPPVPLPPEFEEPSAPPDMQSEPFLAEPPSGEVAALLKRPRARKFPWKRLAQLGSLLSLLLLIAVLMFYTPLGKRLGLRKGAKGDAEKAADKTIINNAKPPKAEPKTTGSSRYELLQPPAPEATRKSFAEAARAGSKPLTSTDKNRPLPASGTTKPDRPKLTAAQQKPPKRTSRSGKSTNYIEMIPESRKPPPKRRRTKRKAAAKTIPVIETPTPIPTPKAILALDKALRRGAGGTKKLLKADLGEASKKLKNEGPVSQPKVAKAIDIKTIGKAMEIDVSIPMLTEVKLGSTKLSAADFKKKLKQKIRPASTCYLKELQRDPRLAGKVVVSFTVMSNGRFSGASIVRSEISSASLHRCLKRKINRLHLGQALGEDAGVFYNFNFKGAPKIIDFTKG